MFERETRREKILEARNKELRLKEKTKGILGLGGGGLLGGGGGAFGNIAATTLKPKGGDDDQDGGKEEQVEDVDPIVKAEREFFEIIKKEQETRMEQRKQKQDPEKETD